MQIVSALNRSFLYFSGSCY